MDGIKNSPGFTARMQGVFWGVLGWHDLDALWARVRAQPEGWYASLVGETPPDAPLAPDALARFVDEVDALLRREHEYDYCGIVYTDDLESPSFVKIYDPNNLGSSCGCSTVKIPPRWVLSRIPPERVEDTAPMPNGRRRWWQRLFAQPV